MTINVIGNFLTTIFESVSTQKFIFHGKNMLIIIFAESWIGQL